jgi:HD-GYP domain-containing protein (c-di-GMP phosphodiesterase class II)
MLMTGAHVFDRTVALQAINTGEIFRFLAKPFSHEDAASAVVQALDRFTLSQENQRLQEQLAEQNLQLERANQRLSERIRVEEEVSRSLREETVSWRRALKDSVDLCLHIMERLDQGLHAHSMRVASLSVAIGKEMGLNPDLLEKLELAGCLHDLGLLGASASLQASQRAPQQLPSVTDRDLVEQHPAISADLARFLPHPDVLDAIRCHHELIDGTGYPNQLSGERIPLLASILTVADAFEEMPGAREFALSAIEIGAGTQFHPEPARALVRLLRAGTLPMDSEKSVLLSELTPGMRLASPIFTASGMLLYREGQILTDGIIAKIRQHGMLNNISQNFLIRP